MLRKFIFNVILGSCVLLYFNINQSVAQKMQFGPRFGLNLNPIGEKTFSGQTYDLSICPGIFADYKLNKSFYFHPELNYNIKNKAYSYVTTSNFVESISSLLESFGSFGGAIGGLIPIDSLMNSSGGMVNDSVYNKIKGHVSLSYIEIPLLIKYQYKVFSFSAGPYIGILTGAKIKEELIQDIPMLDALSGSLDVMQNTLDSIGGGFFPISVKGVLEGMYKGYYNPDVSESSGTSGYNRFDYGLIANLSCKVEKHLEITIRYTHGFPKYIKNDHFKTESFNTYQLSIAYNIARIIEKSPKL